MQEPIHHGWQDSGPRNFWPLRRPLVSLKRGLHYCEKTGKITSTKHLVKHAAHLNRSLGAPDASACRSPGIARGSGPPGKFVRKSVLKKQADAKTITAERRAKAIASLNDTGPGFLQRGKVRSAKGRQNYEEGCAAFRAWRLRVKGSDSLLLSGGNLDDALDQYVEHFFLNNDGVFSARMAVYGEAWKRDLNLKDPKTLEHS